MSPPFGPLLPLLCSSYVTLLSLVKHILCSGLTVSAGASSWSPLRPHLRRAHSTLLFRLMTPHWKPPSSKTIETSPLSSPPDRNPINIFWVNERYSCWMSGLFAFTLWGTCRVYAANASLWNRCSNALDQGLANHSLWAKSSPTYVFINKYLSKYIYLCIVHGYFEYSDSDVIFLADQTNNHRVI